MGNRISDEELLADLGAVAREVGHSPIEREYNDKGQYRVQTFRNRFGSWPEAKRQAGLDPGQIKNPSEEQLLSDIRRVAELVGRPPSQKEYNDKGTWTAKTVENHFESWVSAREQAGLEGGPMAHERIPDEDLIAELKRLTEELGRIPKQRDFKEGKSKYSDATYYYRFGSLTAALRKAGFEPRARGAQPGEANHYWRGGYEPYYGSNWYEQREAARERDGYECVNCGLFEAEHQDEYGRELEVHHRTPLREFDEPEAANTLDNLVTLCRSCHKAVEDGKLDLQA